MKNRVSILVPVYNVEPYIERCARSLFEQTYPNLEYVFVNDGTPDRSMEILLQVMECYPDRKDAARIVNHEKNRGLAAARNTALDNATGDFVTMVDSDDWLELNAIEYLVKKQMETGADIVSGNAFFHDNAGKVLYREPVYGDMHEMLIRIIDNSILYNHSIWRRIIRRSLYEQWHIRAQEGCDMGEDLFQMVQLSYYAKKACVTGSCVYNYNMCNSQSIMNQEKNAQCETKRQLLDNWFGICDFFSDKEKGYYDESLLQTVRQLKITMNIAIKDRNKSGYQILVDKIRVNRDVLRLMGWENGWVDSLKHNYYSMRAKQLLCKCFCRIKHFSCALVNGKKNNGELY